MSQALVARAASFGASALLMGGLVLLALTMTYVVQETEIFGPQPPLIDMAYEPPLPPPPQATTTRPQTAPVEDPFVTEPFQPMETRSTEPLEPYIGPLTPVGPIEITSPHWQRRPSDLTRYYPDRALGRNIEGEAVLNCLVATSGLLNCDVVSETPTGWGFGEAAQRIARAHRMVPATRSGVAVEGRYVMRVPFQID
jgi:periplasmic protein TonB